MGIKKLVGIMPVLLFFSIPVNARSVYVLPDHYVENDTGHLRTYKITENQNSILEKLNKTDKIILALPLKVR